MESSGTMLLVGRRRIFTRGFPEIEIMLVAWGQTGMSQITTKVIPILRIVTAPKGVPLVSYIEVDVRQPRVVHDSWYLRR
jgi:hypothetical protein